MGHIEMTKGYAFFVENSQKAYLVIYLISNKSLIIIAKI